MTRGYVACSENCAARSYMSSMPGRLSQILLPSITLVPNPATRNLAWSLDTAKSFDEVRSVGGSQAGHVVVSVRGDLSRIAQHFWVLVVEGCQTGNPVGLRAEADIGEFEQVALDAAIQSWAVARLRQCVVEGVRPVQAVYHPVCENEP